QIELFRRELSQAGIEPDRLVVLPQLTPLQIVELLKHATAYLDTFPFSGGASLIEPTAALCPVVGLRGSTQRGCLGGAMMTALGIEELIAATPEEYVALAVKLARDPEMRRRMVEQMRKASPQVAFLDVPRF